MHIGILQADEVRPEFQKRFGDYPEMFETLLRRESASSLRFSTYRIQQYHYPASLEACDAFLITGSRNSVYEESDWIRRLGEYVVRLHQARKKLVGICFGHQLIAQVLGGKTERANQGWAVGVQNTRVIEPQHWMIPGMGSFNLISSHQDQVLALPERAIVVAGSEFCPIGGFTIDDHILTFQGHPEFTREYSSTLIEMRRELLGESCYRQGLASLSESTHERLVARWILQFFGINPGP